MSNGERTKGEEFPIFSMLPMPLLSKQMCEPGYDAHV
jgi:hypothetical protein